jgi:hypothetical protein
MHFQCTYLIRIFWHTLDNAFSAYLLNQSILAHPPFNQFRVPTQPKYSSTTLVSTISAYLLDQDIQEHRRFRIFSVPTRPKYSGAPSIPDIRVPTWPRYSSAPSIQQFQRTYSTKIFRRTLVSTISTYLLRLEYSGASTTNPFPHTYSTKLFKRTLDSTSSASLLDQSILACPRFHNFCIPTRPKYSTSAPSIQQFQRTYSIKIF